jgi:hypothetical protein
VLRRITVFSNFRTTRVGGRVYISQADQGLAGFI